MADHSSPNYKDLYLKAEEGRKQAEEREKRAGEREKQEAERRRQAEERNQQTSFTELLQHSHDLLSRQLRVETPSRSTTGKIPLPTGKDCPTRLEHWVDCPEQLLRVYRSVCQYLQSELGQAPRLFSSLPELEGLGRRFARKPLSSEQDLEAYERFGVEEHVHDIIAELCKIPAACDEFGLGDGIQFSNHTNSLTRNETFEADTSQVSNTPHPRPDQFCIHRVDGNTTTVLTTVEYKPPHKLPVATLRMGLRPMDLWKKMVRSNKIPTDQDAKLRYNAERLVCSAIVQKYHVMIQEGLEYSYLTNGIARVLLRVPRDDPTTFSRALDLVRPMNYRRHLRCRLPQRAVECLHALKPAVHLRRSDRVHGHLTRPGPTQIKHLAISGGSVKSRLHRPLDDQVASKSQCMTKKKIIPDAALHNFAHNDVYSACRPENHWMGCVQTWTITAGAKTTRLSILSRLKI
ncbi:hypothetical protein E8E15_008547 [Penicillium rubens]|nr:hypothetical protein E8E15_008547 [Penicillium rubens]